LVESLVRVGESSLRHSSAFFRLPRHGPAHQLCAKRPACAMAAALRGRQAAGQVNHLRVGRRRSGSRVRSLVVTAKLAAGQSRLVAARGRPQAARRGPPRNLRRRSHAASLMPRLEPHCVAVSRPINQPCPTLRRPLRRQSPMLPQLRLDAPNSRAPSRRIQLRDIAPEP
jgi:hypothetical protein